MHEWECRNKIELVGTGCKDAEWFKLAENGLKRRPLVINHSFPPHSLSDELVFAAPEPWVRVTIFFNIIPAENAWYRATPHRG